MEDGPSPQPQTLIVCIDGTWCPARAHPGGVTRYTNVVRIFRHMEGGGPRQRQFYSMGVGTGGLLRKYTGGIWGFGSRRLIREAYRFVCSLYEPGDQIALFGFSRGAFAVRAVAAVINAVGILREDSLRHAGRAVGLARSASRHRLEKQVKFREAHSFPTPTVSFIGVWDTVTSHGPYLPWLRRWLEQRLDRRFGLIDTTVPPCVRQVAHALALDEVRTGFSPWRARAGHPGQTVEEEWFAGYHSDVGGGNLETGPADIALEWMIEKAMAAGIQFKTMPTVDEEAHLAPLTPSRKGVWLLLPRRPRQLEVDDTLHPSAHRRAEQSDYAHQARKP